MNERKIFVQIKQAEVDTIVKTEKTKNIEGTFGENQRVFFSEGTEYVTQKKDAVDEVAMKNRFRRGVLLSDAKKYPQIFSDYLKSCTAYVCNEMVVYPPLVISVRVNSNEKKNMNEFDKDILKDDDVKDLFDDGQKTKRKTRDKLPNITSKLKEKNKRQKSGEELFLVENYQDLPQVSVNIELSRAKTVSEKIIHEDVQAQELLSKYLNT